MLRALDVGEADLALENEKKGDLYTEMRAALIRTYEQNQVAIWDAVMNFTYYLVTGWSLCVGMNLAYQLHVPGPALPDVGYRLIPEWPGSFSTSEYLLFGILYLTMFQGFAGFKIPYSWRDLNPRWDLMSSFLRTMAVVNVMRVLCFLCTQLPGPAIHCRPGSPVYDPPKNIFERADFARGCGDLIPSGHTMLLLVCVMVWHDVSRNSLLTRVFIWGYALVFMVLVISQRKHYTIDVLVALYLVPLVYNRVRTGWHLEDIISPHVKAAADAALRQAEDERLRGDYTAVDLEGPDGPRSPRPHSKRVSRAKMIFVVCMFILSALVWIHLGWPFMREHFTKPLTKPFWFAIGLML